MDASNFNKFRGGIVVVMNVTARNLFERLKEGILEMERLENSLSDFCRHIVAGDSLNYETQKSVVCVGI